MDLVSGRSMVIQLALEEAVTSSHLLKDCACIHTNPAPSVFQDYCSSYLMPPNNELHSRRLLSETTGMTTYT